jgi:glucan endo-1,3-beta-D-glucosidase
MRISAAVAALVACVPYTTALYQGFNIGANNEDGSCKTQAQWSEAFNKLKALPQNIKSVRLFASSDCNTLANAVPAALGTGTQILVGVWTQDEGHFTREKDALEAAIKAHGTSWILAVSVGSEDLYRGGTNVNRLAEQIYDVRGMVRALGVNSPVGHVDTWSAWVDGANDVVTKACDFVGLDAYPYWQSASIDNAYDVFFKAMQDTKNHVNTVTNGIPIW